MPRDLREVSITSWAWVWPGSPSLISIWSLWPWIRSPLPKLHQSFQNYPEVSRQYYQQLSKAKSHQEPTAHPKPPQETTATIQQPNIPFLGASLDFFRVWQIFRGETRYCSAEHRTVRTLCNNIACHQPPVSVTSAIIAHLVYPVSSNMLPLSCRYHTLHCSVSPPPSVPPFGLAFAPPPLSPYSPSAPIPPLY